MEIYPDKDIDIDKNIMMDYIKEINTYLQLFNPPSWRAICLIHYEGSVIHKFTQSRWITNLIEFLTIMNNNSYNIYVTPSELKEGARRRRKVDFKLQQNLIYLDIDDKSSYDKISKHYPTPTTIITTSNNHYQVYWKLKSTITKSIQESIMKRIVYHVKADISSTDTSRIMRVPGFKNCKQGKGDIVKLIHHNNITHNIDDISSIAPVLPQKKKQSQYPVTIEKRITKKNWENFIKIDKDGSINCSSIDFSYTLYLLRYGTSAEEIKERLLNESYNLASRKGNNLDYYIDRTINNAIKVL